MYTNDRVNILGVPFDKLTMQDVVDITKETIDKREKGCKMFVAPNVEFVINSLKDDEMFKILNESELSIADSAGIIWASKEYNDPLPERLPGNEWVDMLIKESVKYGWTFYFLGGKPEVVKLAKEKMEKKYKGCKIVGYSDGYFEKEDEQKIIDKINELSPNILIVCLGSPRQEKWIHGNKDKLKVDIATGQGGTFDFFSGKAIKAPKIMQKLSLEWLYRLIKQPSRIGRMMAIPKFMYKVVFTNDKTRGGEKDGYRS